MRRGLLQLTLVILIACSALAQQTGGGGGGGNGVGISTVAGLPAGKPAGTVYVVTDGNSGTDCTVGGGANFVFCRYSGSAWGTFSGGSAAAGGLTTQVQYNNAGAIAGISGWTTNGTTGLNAGASSILDLHLAAAGGLLLPGALATGIVKVTTSTGALSILTAPAGTIVGTSDTQALTNKDLTGAGNTFPTFNQNTTGSAASFTGSLVGDVTGTQGATVVGKVNGNTVPSLAAAHQALVCTGVSTCVWKTLPDCNGASNALNYTQSTDLFSCLSIATLSNPMTTLGDLIYGGAAGASTRLAGPTATNGVTQFLTSVPSAGAATAPAWAPGGVVPNAQVGTTYTVLATDRLGYVSFSNAGAIAVTLPQAGTTGFASNFAFVTCDIGAGTATITPTTSTISYSTGSAYTSAAASMQLTTGQCAWIYADNTNYFAIQRPGSGGGGSFTLNSGTAAAFSVSPEFVGLLGNNQSNPVTTESQVQAPYAQSQTISKLYVQLSAAIAAATSVTYTLRKNGVSQALTCTVAASTSSCNDTTHSFTVAAGDLLDMQITYTGAPGTPVQYWSMVAN